MTTEYLFKVLFAEAAPDTISLPLVKEVNYFTDWMPQEWSGIGRISDFREVDDDKDVRGELWHFVTSCDISSMLDADDNVLAYEMVDSY